MDHILAQPDPLHGDPVYPFPYLRTDLRYILSFRNGKFIRSYIRKDRIHILPVILILPGQFREFLVGPDHPAFHIHNGIRKGQILQDTLFQNLILAGESDQIIKHLRPVIQKDPHSARHINQCTQGHYQTCFAIDHVNQDVQCDQQDRQV